MGQRKDGSDAPLELAFSAAVVGAGCAAAWLVVCVLSRRVGLLGFEDGQTSPEAVIATAAAVVALCSHGSWLARAQRPALSSRRDP